MSADFAKSYICTYDSCFQLVALTSPFGIEIIAAVNTAPIIECSIWCLMKFLHGHKLRPKTDNKTGAIHCSQVAAGEWEEINIENYLS